MVFYLFILFYFLLFFSSLYFAGIVCLREISLFYEEQLDTVGFIDVFFVVLKKYLSFI